MRAKSVLLVDDLDHLFEKMCSIRQWFGSRKRRIHPRPTFGGPPPPAGDRGSDDTFSPYESCVPRRQVRNGEAVRLFRNGEALGLARNGEAVRLFRNGEVVLPATAKPCVLPATAKRCVFLSEVDGGGYVGFHFGWG